MARRIEAEELKKRELNMLRSFAEYCDKHDLCYVLGGGTLLGAIRHQGFIPWDDDIDVMMPREDFLRFIELQKEKKELAFVSIEDNTMSYPFMKILDPEVVIDMTYVENTGSENLWIDVFPIDGLPADNVKNRLLFEESLFLRTLLLISNAKMGKGTTWTRMLAKIPVHYLLKPIGAYRIAHSIDRLCRKIPFAGSEYVGGLAWGYGPQERMPCKEWLERVKVTFEGEEFYAPGCYDLYLKSLYGDYMKLPPKEKQIPHHMIAWLKEK